MACGDDMKTLLSRHVDGELSPEEKANVEAHVVSCASCKEMLELFRKNESLLSNALSTESFGNTVIEAVISEIKKEGQPAEAKPVDESPLEWVRSRPFVQLAAAALLVVGLVVILTWSHERQMAALKKETDSKLGVLQGKVFEQQRTAGQMQDEYSKLITDIRTEKAFSRAPGTVSGYMTPQQLVVRASFDPKLFGSFAIYRRAQEESDDRFVRLMDRRLDTPEYFDAAVRPGQGYVYKFRAYRSAKEDDFVESVPVLMRVPKVQELEPEKSIRIQCLDIAVNFKVAKFLLYRTLNGVLASEEFLVKPGEQVGELRELPGIGRVDFRTGLTLESLKDGTQPLAVSYTSPLLDSEGNPVIKEFNGRSVEVATEQREAVISIRPNLRAFFRRGGATDVELWKGSWIEVHAQQ